MSTEPQRDSYTPQDYWSRRLREHWGLHGVGYLGFSRRYNRTLYRAKERALRGALRDHAIPVDGRAVLDLGFGTGHWLRWYRDHGASVAGLDVSSTAVERMRAELPDLELHMADLGETWPVAGRFDLVNAFDVFYHVTSDAAFENALRQVAERLAPGGWLIASDRFGDEDVSLHAHVRFRSLPSYARMLRRNGIQVEEIRPLYWLLNGGVSDRPWLTRSRRLHHAARLVEDIAAPLLYVIDGRVRTPPPGNLRLLVARKTAA